MAADAITGKPLWSFQTNQTWRASPMTYMFDGQQYIAVAAGSTIIALAIQDSTVGAPRRTGQLRADVETTCGSC